MAHRGRPRKVGVKREESGKVERSTRCETERQIKMTAVAARVRVFGVNENHAHDSRAGSELGRMELRGVINSEQHDAALIYLDVRNAYQRAIEARPDFNQPKPETSGNGEHENFCRLAIDRYENMRSCINEYMIAVRSPLGYEALNLIVIKDEHIPHLEKPLARLLQWLHDKFVCVKAKRSFH